jgi:hypothetical protein
VTRRSNYAKLFAIQHETTVTNYRSFDLYLLPHAVHALVANVVYPTSSWPFNDGQWGRPCYNTNMNATNSTSIASPGESAFDPYVIIGPVVLGALVNASFFGCLVIQTYFYYANFAKDHRTIKLMVSDTDMRNLNR